MIYIFGKNSRLLHTLAFDFEYKAISLREEVGEDVVFKDGDVLIFFADPPSVNLTLSLFTRVLLKIKKNTCIKLIYMSSIAAASGIGKYEQHERGIYRARKLAAEQLFLSRDDLEVHVLRVGNVLINSNWESVIDSAKLVVLPRECMISATASLEKLKFYIIEATNSSFKCSQQYVTMYEPVHNNKVFKKVFYSSLIGFIYKYGCRFCLKLILKSFKMFGVILVSPDDINSVCCR